MTSAQARVSNSKKPRRFVPVFWPGLLGKTTHQYALAIVAVFVMSVINYWLQRSMGYQALALNYLLAVVLLAPVVNRGAILLAAFLTAVAWAFLFVPPRYSFHIASIYDKVMVLTYFTVAVVVGQLTARLRILRDAELETKLLAESERLGRTLLNSVSHEFRTPIATIMGAASSLRAEGGLSQSQQRWMVEIQSAGARLNRVVESLLSAARLQSGQLQPARDWCEIRDVVNGAVHEWHDLLADHPLTIDVPAGLNLVKLDFALTQQALGNILANAALHTPPNTPISISARMQGAEFSLQVRDCGRGLPPEELERVFHIFHRLPDAKPGGTGLGLAIVKGFIEAQGGRVEAANHPEGGALFTISLPAAEKPKIPEENS